MELVFVPLDSVRVSLESLEQLRTEALEQLDEARKGRTIIGQHVVTSADHTAVWLVFVLEKNYRENGKQ